jgi:Icc-related predicted phosphoesterase
VIRVGAVGDIHLGEDARGHLRPALERIGEYADVLLLAGDLTRHGTASEGKIVADEVGGLPVPVVAVLGNHDYHSDQQGEIAAILAGAGVHVLEGTSVVLPVGGRRLGVAGVKGFGGGFAGKCATEFGEPQIKSFIRHTKDAAAALHAALSQVDGDVRLALTHYSPAVDTVRGEPPEIYPWLGSYLLAEAIDAAGADLAVHGHAHAGTEKGLTPGGTRVRNVAQPVIRRAYAVYCLGT